MKATDEFKTAWAQAKNAQNLDNDDNTVEVHGEICVYAKSRQEAYDKCLVLYGKFIGMSINSLLSGGLSDEGTEIQENGSIDFTLNWEGEYSTMKNLQHDLQLMNSGDFYFVFIALSRTGNAFYEISEMFKSKEGHDHE